MDVLFLAFANSREDPLPTLREEDDSLYKTLSPRALKQHFLLHRDSYANIDSITYYLSQYRNHVRIFLYSGHAGRDSLILDQETAHAKGIIHLLSQCPLLQLVFLNGCSTEGQVTQLLEKNIPAVIATSAPVDDRKAAEFSIRFFQALNDQSSILEAFELAKGDVLTRYPDLEVSLHRGIKVDEPDPVKADWGLFTREEQAEALSWKLPLLTKVAQTEDFTPNVLLMDTLLETLAPFREEIAKIVEEEALGAEKSVLDKREAILKALPHPVSEQLRKLLVDPGPGISNVTFYHEAGPDRLHQIVLTYNTFLELLAFVMLAQLWEVTSKKEKVHLPEEQLKTIRHFFHLSAEDRNKYIFIDLIRSVRLILDSNESRYFVEELHELVESFNEESELYQSTLFLEHLKQKLSGNPVDEAEAKELCIIAEEKLSQFLQHSGFLANYTLASVKNIDVLKYRHFTTPKYKHSLVKLVQRFVGLAEDQEIRDEYLDCDSILLMKNRENGNLFLNLSPFIIDENAFDEKASIAKLYFFDRYDKGQDTYTFKHVYKPNDLPLVIEKQKHFQILKAQFDAFAKSVFNQPMNSL